MRLHLHRILCRKVIVFVLTVSLMIFVLRWFIRDLTYVGSNHAHNAKREYGGKGNNIGELGVAVTMPSVLSNQERQEYEQGMNRYGLNLFISNRISKTRSLPDTRPKQCKSSGRYIKYLPQTDIIICFHMEPWSTLIRTVHSILERTPYELINHIILVDDFSNTEQSGIPLEDYWSIREPKVKIIRTTKREGLIRAKLLGFQYGTAPVATFLDAHCECNVGWLEPLLDRLMRNPNTVACPTIDFINHKTFAYTYIPHEHVWVGGFNWDLNFKWIWEQDTTKKGRRNIADPVKTPIMSGGLFSVRRDYFRKLGAYDEGFNIWGGENLELSFKTWMCGGAVEILPCSRVGHMAKTHHPYNLNSTVIAANSRRLARVWMDEYEKYFVELLNPKMKQENVGDVTSRLELKRNLKCNSFKWYLDNIYPEIFRPELEVVKYVEISTMNRMYCLSAKPFRTNLEVTACSGTAGDQKWAITTKWEITRDYWAKCLEYRKRDSVVTLGQCNHSSENQKWSFDLHFKRLQNDKEQCLTLNNDTMTLITSECDSNLPAQLWMLSTIKR